MVLLQAGKRYEVEEEIWIRRRVVVMGNPSLLPVLDGEDAVRTFHVVVSPRKGNYKCLHGIHTYNLYKKYAQAGGFLELRFVQILMSDGIFRDAYPWEFATSRDGKVNEIRGGSVMFDSGAAGGIFTGVFFIDDPDIDKALQRNIRRTLNRETYRIYGGHVFVAGGEIGKKRFHYKVFLHNHIDGGKHTSTPTREIYTHSPNRLHWVPFL